jgi:ariadne-1
MKNASVLTSFLYFDRSSVSGRQELDLLLRHHVNRVSQSLGNDADRAQVLLFDFKFSIKKLVEALELGNQKILYSSGLDFSHSGQQGDSDGCCGICYDEIVRDDIIALDCGHSFCLDCWVQYLETFGKQGKYAQLKMCCPQQGCVCRVLPAHLESISKALQVEWQDTFSNAFLEYACQACPAQTCQFVATTSLVEHDDVATSCCCLGCNQVFCFGCREKPHEPATCEDVAEWTVLQQESELYVRKNTKPCPGCRAPIEKAQGCNHMTCTCGVQFCWLCLTQLGQHSERHNCNRYRPVDDARDNDERRALFVAERFEAHLQANEFAASQYESTKKRIDFFAFISEQDENALCGALLTLCNARRYLRNSYVASFGLRGNKPGLHVLESYQGALEMLTERLSHLTETNLQRLYQEKGERGVKNHFHGLGFFSMSVSNYMDRMSAVIRESKQGR